MTVSFFIKFLATLIVYYFYQLSKKLYKGFHFATILLRFAIKYCFAVYCTYSALIYFTIHVHLYRRRAALCIFSLAIAPWKEISKTSMKWKLALSDRNNCYFYTDWLKKGFLTGFKKVGDVYYIYSTSGNISYA